MGDLKQLQTQFQAYLLGGDEQAMLKHIAPDERFSALNRLRVYHDAYYLRLLEVLKLDFPKTHTLLGDEAFEKAFFQYIAKHPSTHFSVRYFGQHFSPFLTQTAPYKDYPVIAEMAQFEWAIAHTLDAEDAPVVTPQMLATLPAEKWPEVAFTFHPSLISLSFAWDTPQLWQHIENEQPPRDAIKLEQPILWLCWRHQLRCLFQSCNAAEEKMFLAIQEGLNFAEICEALNALLPAEAVPMTAAQTLHKWVGQGMLSTLV